MTPLHHAVRSADSLTSTRQVRALLMKGARTDLKDKKGMLASDYIKEIQSSRDLRINL